MYCSVMCKIYIFLIVAIQVCPVLCVLLHSVSITNQLVCVNEILFVNSEVFSWAIGWPLQGLSLFFKPFVSWSTATTFPLNGMPRYDSSPPDVLSEVAGESTLFDQKASALIIILSTLPSNHSCNNQPLLSGCQGNTFGKLKSLDIQNKLERDKVDFS